MSILFHASQNKDLAVIEPRRTLSKDKYIGDFVFATSNRSFAVMYLASKGTATLMNPQPDNPDIVICADEAKYMENDVGGAIYELPSDGFTTSPQKGLSDFEMVSKSPVKPLRKTTYAKSVDAMLATGIKIHFTDKQTFISLIGTKNQAKSVKALPVYNRE